MFRPGRTESRRGRAARTERRVAKLTANWRDTAFGHLSQPVERIEDAEFRRHDLPVGCVAVGAL